jgi:hypothetical protein
MMSRRRELSASGRSACLQVLPTLAEHAAFYYQPVSGTGAGRSSTRAREAGRSPLMREVSACCDNML